MVRVYYYLKCFLMNCWSSLLYIFFIKFITWKMKSIFTPLIEILLLCHWMLKSLFIVEYLEFHFLLKSTNFVHYMFILHFLYSNLICLNEHFMRSKYLFVSNISTFSSVFLYVYAKTFILFRALFSCKIRNPLNILFIFLL